MFTDYLKRRVVENTESGDGVYEVRRIVADCQEAFDYMKDLHFKSGYILSTEQEWRLSEEMSQEQMNSYV